MSNLIAKPKRTLLDTLSVHDFLSHCPLPTLLFDANDILCHGNTAFHRWCSALGATCYDVDSFLELLVQEDAQRILCKAMLVSTELSSSAEWCPVVFVHGETRCLGALQAWKIGMGNKALRVAQLILQPDESSSAGLSFAPESGAPRRTPANGLVYFNSAAHAAYNLWLLLDRLPCGVVLFDDHERLVGINQHIKDSYGYSSKDCATLREWWVKVHPQEDCTELYSINANKQFFGPIESIALSKDGIKRSVLVERASMAGGWSSVIYENMFSSISGEDNIHKLREELRRKAEQIQEMSAAMRVVLELRNSDKKVLESTIQINIHNRLFPHIDRLYRLSTDDTHRKILDLIRHSIENITSEPMLAVVSEQATSALTPREAQIAEMLAKDMNTKEISRALCLSKSSVGYYRNILRRKLGIIDQKVNLKAALRAFLNAHA